MIFSSLITTCVATGVVPLGGYLPESRLVESRLVALQIHNCSGF
jgi:hypothetical protein